MNFLDTAKLASAGYFLALAIILLALTIIVYYNKPPSKSKRKK